MVVRFGPAVIAMAAVLGVVGIVSENRGGWPDGAPSNTNGFKISQYDSPGGVGAARVRASEVELYVE